MIRNSCLAALAIALVAMTDPAIAQSPCIGIPGRQIGNPVFVPPSLNRVVLPSPIATGSCAPGPAGFLQGVPVPQPDAEDPVAALAVKAKAPAKFEEVVIQTRDKQNLAASYYPPKAKGRAPAVLLIHDAGKERSGFEDVAALLQKRGFAVLTIDLRGHGASVSPEYNWGTTAEPDQGTLWAFATRDLDAATEFLRNRSDVHNSNLSLVGVGAGGALAVRYAKDDVNTRAVVLIEPSPRSYGFETYKDVVELAGLPTLLMVSTPEREGAERLQIEAHRQNDGINYVSIKSVKPKNGDPLADRRVATEVTSFLRDEAMPKR